MWKWSGSGWTQYTAANTQGGLGNDNVYALAFDAKNRLWAGTLHGVSVYNGQDWKNYGPVEGLGGWRVFAEAVSPIDGDIWIVTEGGLTRYSLKHNAWTQYSRVDGLPSDSLSCLTFAPDGTLYVGTQADGLTISSPASGYLKWNNAPGPAALPVSPSGDGLPSGLINCLLVAKNGTVYIGTDNGMARSNDAGQTWRYLRGANWSAMVQGEYPPATPVPTDTGGHLLTEDYVTCLAQDAEGRIWVGHRQTGLEVDTPQGLWIQLDSAHQPVGDYVDALLTRADGSTVIGGYGGGLASITFVTNTNEAPQTAVMSTPVAVASTAPLPSPEPMPTFHDLNEMLKTVDAVRPDPNEYQPKVVALDDDWATQGNWLGRYGKYWACLCAMSYKPLNYIWGAGWEKVDYRSRMGPHHNLKDKLRYWVQWMYTKDPRVLEMPEIYLDSRIKKGLTDGNSPRRESEEDDHGEVYHKTQEGPGIYETITIPSGLFYLSFYEMNYDGHLTGDRIRDYILSIRRHSGKNLADNSDFDQEEEFATGRVDNFWEGVWKRFLVRGPMILSVKVGRNHSFNTILQSIMLDLVDEMPPPYFGTMSRWKQEQVHKKMLWQMALMSHGTAHAFQSAKMEEEAANSLLTALQEAHATNSTWWAENSHRFYMPLVRWYLGHLNKQDTMKLATCEYQTGLYPQWEKNLKIAGLTPARDIEKALKWDGITDINHDYTVVKSYMKNHPQVAVMNSDNRQRL